MVSRHAEIDIPSYDLVFGQDGHLAVSGTPIGRGSASFHVGDHVIANAFESVLPPALTDLVDVALAVYLADRACKRIPPGVNRERFGWSRRIRIQVPVSNPVLWSTILRPLLNEALMFFTEDEWNVEFEDKGSQEARGPAQLSLFPFEIRPPVRVALFSGGLDSLAGLCNDILSNQYASVVLFAGRTNSRLAGVQQRLVTRLEARLQSHGPAIVPCIVPFGFVHRPQNERNRDENTQRTRGFLYSVFGAITAVMAGSDRIAFYENGIGCINLPYTRAQFGTHLTRATHPLAMMRMEQLLSAALGRPFYLDLPNLFRTKGELCESLGRLGVPELASVTVSCDGVPRMSSRSHCGLCTSCLLRRQSLHAAGLGAIDSTDEYIADALGDLSQIKQAKLYPLRAMLHQVEQLRKCLATDDPFASLAAVYPELLEISLLAPEARLPADAGTRLVALYQRYCEEWDHFVTRPIPPRWHIRAERLTTYA